jgi:hypothetical protein
VVGDQAAGRGGIPARPPEFAAGPARPRDFPPGPQGPADHPDWSGDVTVAPNDRAAGRGGFAGGPGPGLGTPTQAYPGGPYDPRGLQGTSGRTNGFAIAAFVLGLLGVVLLSVIFGIIALRQIPRRMQRGRGLAIAGLAISGGWVVLMAGLIFLGATTPPPKPPVSAPTVSPSAGPGGTNVFALRTGQCFQNPPASQTVLGITYVTVVPCTTSHNAQVFVQFSAVGSRYPGNASLKRQADLGCHARIVRNVQKSKITDTMTLRYLYPLPTSWAAGHRTVTCLIVDAKPDLKSSLLRTHPGH